MKISFLTYFQYFVFTAEILFSIWVANKVFDRFYGKIQPIANGNIAVAIQRIGYSFGCSLAAISAIEHIKTAGFFQTSIQILTYGLIASAFVLMASVVNDKIITTGVDDNAEIQKGNLAVAFVDASAVIATGLITAASFSGNGNSPWYAPIVFFVIGQLALVVTAKVWQKYAEMEPIWLIGNDVNASGNIAAGISLGGLLIATGITLRNAISGPFIGWTEDIVAVLGSYSVGMIVIFAVAIIVPKIFLGKSQKGEVENGNIAFASFTAIFKIILALAVGMVIP
jgi:uncharacterized membrane protein YjfL (UPF0719 family)